LPIADAVGDLVCEKDFTLVRNLIEKRDCVESDPPTPSPLSGLAKRGGNRALSR
jgi:hypothetical protein